MNERYKSVFDIIGPIMIGPSSSHTAGTVQIGRMARAVFGGTPAELTVHYYESFAHTHAGHGTDYAIVAGVMGMATDDRRVPMATRMARTSGMKVSFIEENIPSPVGHPNTARLLLSNQDHSLNVEVTGCSIGGGTIEIRHLRFNDVEFDLPGQLPVIIFRDTRRNSRLHTSLMRLIDKLAPFTSQQTARGQRATVYAFTLKNRLTPKVMERLKLVVPDLIFMQPED
ncbi:serine dehydratase beta chain [uncultured Limosilactobacillus sp.]|uniref:serine dehydratase beta chain n=1 Tax=uncultured Limosilactobacillus sp. TaxID=2837629 RepID=UPI0025FD4CCD|nr:serine dehydratase beta chain [uncultured Limosilactobacillus sp.]